MKPKKRTYEIRAVVEEGAYAGLWHKRLDYEMAFRFGVDHELTNVEIKSIRVRELKARKG